MNSSSSNSVVPDAILVKSALKGDEGAFSSLFRRYKDGIYHMMHKMVRNKHDAEDLTFEAFGKAFKNIHRYSEEYAFSTWLFSVAHNNCVDHLRGKKGFCFPVDNDLESIAGLHSEEPDPEQRLIRIQRAVFLRKIVHRLKPQYRLLIELRYFNEHTYEEIAEELELPLGTIKAQLFRARNILLQMAENKDI